MSGKRHPAGKNRAKPSLVKPHARSRAALLGKDPDPALIEELSNERHVTAETPHCFIWHAADDQAVKVENSMALAAALRSRNVPFELHIYED